MNYTGKNHTFAICAYKESPFLEECIQSLLGQTIPSTIIIVTSTDNAYIQNMAEKYHLELFINHGESGITQDDVCLPKCQNGTDDHRTPGRYL